MCFVVVSLKLSLQQKADMIMLAIPFVRNLSLFGTVKGISNLQKVNQHNL